METMKMESEKSLLELFDMIYLDTTPAVDESICKIISQRIRSKETSLVKVVEELGPRLTSTHVQERSKAVEILAHVFTHLPTDFLTETELAFIVDFLCDRCKDQHLVIPKIIMCVLPIVRCKELPSGAGARLLDALFREANVQSHIHKIRHTFFRIVQVLLASEKHIEELQTMSSDFVMNFLQSMDGEKDPRNLLLLFRIIPKIISKFKLDPFLDDFFDILSCYFPIDFHPTVAIPGEELITRKDLSQNLNVCLSQTNEFAEFLIPLTLEKLESNSIDAKLDSLELLQLCCERSYLPQDLEPFLGQIWAIMRREIFMGGNDDVEKKCYEFLKAAFTMISKDSTILDTCLTMIYSECKHHLSEPELRLIMPTSNILRCITESGEAACTSVIQNLFPVVYEQICLKAAISEKKRLLGIWEILFRTSCQYKGIEFHVLLSNWDEMRALWFTLLTSDDWGLVAVVLNIFSVVIFCDTNFNSNHRHTLQEHLLRLLGFNSCSTMTHEARSAIVSLASSFCNFYGSEYANVSLPRLLITLSHSMSPTEELLCESKCDGAVQCQSRALSVKVLGECSHLHQSAFEKVVSYLLQNLESNSSSCDLLTIECLERIVENSFNHSSGGNITKPDLSPLFTSMCISDRVISLAFEMCKSTSHPMEVEIEPTTSNELGSVTDPGNNNNLWQALNRAATIIRNILRASDEAEQSNTVIRYWNSKIADVSDVERELNDTPGLLIEAILGSVKPSVTISLKKELINCIVNNKLMMRIRVTHVDEDTNKQFHIIPYTRLLASFLNKAEEDDLMKHLNNIEASFEKYLCRESIVCNSNPDQMEIQNATFNEKTISQEDFSSKVNLTNVLIWIVKGLAMRGFQELDIWVEKIMELLKQETIGEEVVKRFHHLVDDDPYSLNEESFCRFKILYRQRLFLMLVDKLVSGYRSASSQRIQFNFIRALSSQLKHVPSEILFIKIDSVLPLLVASLKCNSSSQVLLSTLNALTEMMQSPDMNKKLTEYCQDLVPQLTRLARFKDCMNVRTASLRCLRKCAKAPSHITLPLRDTVVDDLIQCLDDPKRLVRKEAMLTRNIWMLIGAPGGL